MKSSVPRQLYWGLFMSLIAAITCTPVSFAQPSWQAGGEKIKNMVSHFLWIWILITWRYIL